MIYGGVYDTWKHFKKSKNYYIKIQIRKIFTVDESLENTRTSSIFFNYKK